MFAFQRNFKESTQWRSPCFSKERSVCKVELVCPKVFMVLSGGGGRTYPERVSQGARSRTGLLMYSSPDRLLLGRFGSSFGLAWFGFILPFLAVKYEELYCFSFNPKLDKEEREQGWMLIDLSEEYKRMGLPNNYWQLSDVNRDYRVSAGI